MAGAEVRAGRGKARQQKRGCGRYRRRPGRDLGRRAQARGAAGGAPVRAAGGEADAGREEAAGAGREGEAGRDSERGGPALRQGARTAEESPPRRWPREKRGLQPAHLARVRTVAQWLVGWTPSKEEAKRELAYQLGAWWAWRGGTDRAANLASVADGAKSPRRRMEALGCRRREGLVEGARRQAHADRSLVAGAQEQKVD